MGECGGEDQLRFAVIGGNETRDGDETVVAFIVA